MNLVEITGDLLKVKYLAEYDPARFTVLCQAVNAMGVQGAGLALAMKRKYPVQFTAYKTLCDHYPVKDREQLGGTAQMVYLDNRSFVVANLFTQTGYGRDGKYTNDRYVLSALQGLRGQLITHKMVECTDIYIPYKMCSDLGGGHWPTILNNIKETFADTPVNIYIVKKPS